MARRGSMEDWEQLGDTIEYLIDKAVQSKDFQKLNKTVTDAVNEAVGSGAEAVRRAVDSARPLRRTDVHVNRNRYSSKITSLDDEHNRVQKPNLPVLYANPSAKLAGGIVKTVGGALITGFSGIPLIAALAMAAVMPVGAAAAAVSAVLGLGTAGGAWLLTSGIRTITRVERFKKYVQVLGKRTHCDVEQLARYVGKPVKFVRRELPGMIHDGLFLEGHLDEQGTSLITSNETYQHYRNAQREYANRQKQEAERQAAVKVSAQVQEVLDRGNAFIREIRRCNDAIPGQEMTAKISRMEQIVQKIFERAEAHPEIVPDLKKLMDYYLPMTVKLLNAYADMDAQPIQGQTIQSSKREIEATLDTLNAAFEKLLDSVFRETALDVSSDISVLQTLLAQEGLTDDGLYKN